MGSAARSLRPRPLISGLDSRAGARAPRERGSGAPRLVAIMCSGFPCCVRFACVHAAATTPVQQMGVLLAQNSPIRVSLPRFHYRVGLHIDLFEVCSAFTHVLQGVKSLSPRACEEQCLPADPARSALARSLRTSDL